MIVVSGTYYKIVRMQFRFDINNIELIFNLDNIPIFKILIRLE